MRAIIRSPDVISPLLTIKNAVTSSTGLTPVDLRDGRNLDSVRYRAMAIITGLRDSVSSFIYNILRSFALAACRLHNPLHTALDLHLLPFMFTAEHTEGPAS